MVTTVDASVVHVRVVSWFLLLEQFCSLHDRLIGGDNDVLPKLDVPLGGDPVRTAATCSKLFAHWHTGGGQ